MGKRKRQSRYEHNHTPTTLLMASFGGGCAFITIETTFPDLIELWGLNMNNLLRWQVHMGSVCVGTLTFILFLFVLEVLETRSKITAWRSSAPWLPLILLTALATAIHIPFYVVVPIGAIYGIWAYRRTCSVRQSPRLS